MGLDKNVRKVYEKIDSKFRIRTDDVSSYHPKHIGFILTERDLSHLYLILYVFHQNPTFVNVEIM